MMRRDPREIVFFLSATWEHSKKALCQSRGDISPQTDHIGNLITDFQSPEL